MVDPVDALEERSGDASAASQLGGIVKGSPWASWPFHKALFLGGCHHWGLPLDFAWYEKKHGRIHWLAGDSGWWSNLSWESIFKWLRDWTFASPLVDMDKCPKFALPDHHPRLVALGRSSSVFPRFESIWSMEKINHVNTGQIQQMQLNQSNENWFKQLTEEKKIHLCVHLGRKFIYNFLPTFFRRFCSNPLLGHPTPSKLAPASGVAVALMAHGVVSASRSNKSLWRLEGLTSDWRPKNTALILDFDVMEMTWRWT